MILAATLLWAVEVVFVKRLLRRVPPQLARRRAHGLRHGAAPRAGSRSPASWARSRASTPSSGAGSLLTGLLLTAYVATWYAALARAQAIDVTAVLVFGAVVTALLSGRGRRRAGQRGRHAARRGRLRRSIACVALRRPPPEAARVSDAAGAAPVRALRVPAERARPLRRRPSAHAARVRRRRRVRRRPRRARAHVRGRVAVPRADRRRERDRRPARPARRRGLLGRQRAPRPRRPARRSRGTSTTASAAGSAAPASTSSTRSRPARSRTTASTSSPSTRGSACCAPASSTSRCASSTSAGRRRRVVRRRRGRVARRCSRGRSSTRTARLRLGAAGAAHGPLERRRPRASSPARSPGDLVSLHWDFVCDVLSPGAAGRSAGRPPRPARGQSPGRR